MVLKARPLKYTNIDLWKNEVTRFNIAFSLSIDFLVFLGSSPWVNLSSFNSTLPCSLLRQSMNFQIVGWWQPHVLWNPQSHASIKFVLLGKPCGTRWKLFQRDIGKRGVFLSPFKFRVDWGTSRSYELKFGMHVEHVVSRNIQKI